MRNISSGSLSFSQWHCCTSEAFLLAKWMDAPWFAASAENNNNQIGRAMTIWPRTASCCVVRQDSHLILWPAAFVFFATVKRSSSTSAQVTETWAVAGNMATMPASTSAWCHLMTLPPASPIAINNTIRYWRHWVKFCFPCLWHIDIETVMKGEMLQVWTLHKVWL